MLKNPSKEVLSSKPSVIKQLGIDETSFIKNKGNYGDVLIDVIKVNSPDRRMNKTSMKTTNSK